MSIKSTFLTIFLLLLSACGAMAQEKYEYGIVEYNTESGGLIKFYTNKEVITFNNEGLEVDNSYNILLLRVGELSEKGWEVYNNAEREGRPISNLLSHRIMSYHLRRKKN